MFIPGTKVLHYVLTQLLGEGGQAQVWQAKNQISKQTVALKLLPETKQDDLLAKERLKREASIYEMLPSHEGLLKFLGFYPDSDVGPVLCLESLEGGWLLSDFLDTAPSFSLSEKAEIAFGLCGAITVLHRAGVIHRDIKSKNVYVTPVSKGSHKVTLFDFGIAHWEASDLTNPGTPLGTPNTRAPEQEQGLLLDKRTDVYGLGTVLYELFLKKTFPKGESLSSIQNAQLPEKLKLVLLRALESNPFERYPSAAQLESALRAALKPKNSRKTLGVFQGAILLGLMGLSFLAGSLLSLPAPSFSAIDQTNNAPLKKPSTFPVLPEETTTSPSHIPVSEKKVPANKQSSRLSQPSSNPTMSTPTSTPLRKEENKQNDIAEKSSSVLPHTSPKEEKENSPAFRNEPKKDLLGEIEKPIGPIPLTFDKE